MRSKKLRTFIVNEQEMIFNVRLFQELFNKYARKSNVGVGIYEEELADVLFVDKSAVHNWRMNVNGPGDIEKIQQIADFWNIDYESLLMEANNMNMTQNNNRKKIVESEKVALKNVYHSFLEYMEMFKDTLGFWVCEDGSEYRIEEAYAGYENLRYVLKREYIDLKRTVYDKLEEFYNGELAYTLEHGFIPGEDNPYEVEAETLLQYQHMMDEFKSIIDEYLVD